MTSCARATEPPALLSWQKRPATSRDHALLQVGANLAALHQRVANPPVFAGCLADRMALMAAAAGLAGGVVLPGCAPSPPPSIGEIRDAEHFGRSTVPPPGAVLWRFWRGTEGAVPGSAAGIAAHLNRAARLLGLPSWSAPEAEIDESLGGLAPPFASAAALAWRFGAAAGEGHADPHPLLGLLAADLVLARRLEWRFHLSLFGGALSAPRNRRVRLGRGDSDAGLSRSSAADRSPVRRATMDIDGWLGIAAAAVAQSSWRCCALATELAGRAASLATASRQLRTRGSGKAIALLLAHDSLAPGMRISEIGPRAWRRLMARLVALDAARELTGAGSYRLYGL